MSEHHIRAPGEGLKAWCGVSLLWADFCFLNPKHARDHMAQVGNKTVCPACQAAVDKHAGDKL